MTLAALLDDARAAFAARFGRAPTLAAAAPGRVNIIGDHTDYSGGFALPCAVGLYTIAVAAPRSDGDTTRIHSEQRADRPIELPAAIESEARGDWGDYLRGVRWGYAQRGLEATPLDVLLLSNLPVGAGLSSSAALELCFACLLETAVGSAIDPRERALLCQAAERDFAGMPCGILDQFAITFAQAGKAMILDCEQQTTTQTPLPEGVALIAIDSAVKHELTDGAYARRRAELAAAQAALGVALREAGLARLDTLSDPLLQRRARHVVTENQRVHDFAAAMAASDWPRAGALMLASHRSLADDYETSCREIDWLVEAATEAGAFGARMTGGGFGGSVVCLGARSLLPTLRERILPAYREAWSLDAALRELHPVDGARGWHLEKHA